MAFLNRIRRNAELLRYCGLSSLGRFTRSGFPITRVTMKGVGPVHLRLANSDFDTFKQVFVGREYDLRAVGGAGPRIAARCCAIRNSGHVPVIVDAGANVGAASLWFSRSFPDAQIVAIEPDPENAKLLRINVKDEPRISVLEAAIAGEAGSVSLSHTEVGWAVQTVRSDDGEFPAITMSAAVASVPKGALFIAKIDIEGFEADLFAGDQAWIDQAAVVIVEPHDWLFPGRGTSRTFQAAMGPRGYELFISGENLIYVAPDVQP